MSPHRTTCSKKALRIDVDFELERALRLGHSSKPFAQIGRKIEIARRFHQHAEAVAPAHHRERRFGGTEHAHLIVDRRNRGDFPRVGFGGVLVGAGNEQARQPAERRIAGLLAHLDLGRVERLAVLRDQGAHHRMLGLVRLQITVAAPLLAAGAADHLMQQLERALGRARIAVRKSEIGVDNADQIELGEMMALGDELRADDDVETALRHVVQFLPQPLHGVDQVARQHQDAGAGKQLGRLLLQPLDAGADRDEAALRLALRALLGRRHRVAAMVADQPPLEAVIDQPGIAVRAGHAMTAGVAQGQRRKAAAIEEQQRLLLALQRDLHRLGQARRDEASARRRLAPQIDGFDRRADAGRRTVPADEDARSGRAWRSPRSRPTAWRRRARSGFSSRARAPPPCRGRDSERRPPACRPDRALHRRRSDPDRRKAKTAPSVRRPPPRLRPPRPRTRCARAFAARSRNAIPPDARRSARRNGRGIAR